MRAIINKLIKRPVATIESSQGEFEVYLGGAIHGLNILIFSEHINATYYISFDIPLRRLHEQGRANLAVVSQAYVKSKGAGSWESWLETFKPDVVVMTRYGKPYGAEIMAYFQGNNIPVIYHIDDDLLEIPDSLGKEIKQRQGAEDVVRVREKMLSSCDLIYASTSRLGDTLQKRFPDQKVFWGMYAPYLGDQLKSTKPFLARNQKTFGYMGSKGHKQDLELAVPDIERVLEERPDVRFEVFGTIGIPSSLIRFGERVKSLSVQKSYPEFLTTLASLNWDIGLAPLVDAPFNNCKAPTKYIEYSAAGIPVVASNVSVYSNVIPSGGGVLTDKDWYTPIVALLDDSTAQEGTIETARNYCAEAFSIERLSNQLVEVFNLVRN
ncbi:glycosyltransferase family 1 protein [Hahella ganghwensis]|uniref:glycosyltransferase family 1 protein n=1 Tax=Hahella ganghwensis TaxID=286420 RepID=UPI0003603786|nr:glycosyltransferase family 1 protein [Hahella ganghwensis]